MYRYRRAAAVLILAIGVAVVPCAIGLEGAPHTVDDWIAKLDHCYTVNESQVGRSVADMAAEQHGGHVELMGRVARAYRRAGDLERAWGVLSALPQGHLDCVSRLERYRLASARGASELIERLPALIEDCGYLPEIKLLEDRTLIASDFRDHTGYPFERMRGRLTQILGREALRQHLRKAGGCVVTRLGRAQMHEIGDNPMTVSVRVNGHQPLNVAIDTGLGARVVLYADAVKSLQLATVSKSELRGIAGRQESTLSLADRVVIGEIEISNVPVEIVPSSSSDEGIAGLIGLDIFSQHRVSLDRGQKTLEVGVSHEAFDQRGESAVMPFWHFKEKIILCADLGGERRACLFDTGALVSLASRRMASVHNPKPATAAKFDAFGQQLSLQAQLIPSLKVVFAGTTYNYGDLLANSFVDDELSGSLGVDVDLILGQEFLKPCPKWIIDYPQRKIQSVWIDPDLWEFYHAPAASR